ncbi:MAG: DUF4388 domain-containing protein [Actinomycetes bacterium]
MALQGTIDSFPLEDVLSLLDSSSRVGRLSVIGDRASGWVEMANGLLLSAELLGSAVDNPASVLFELLRCKDGEFEFLALSEDNLARSSHAASKLSDCIEESAEILKRWTEIELMIPSTQHQVYLAAKLPIDEILVDGFLWSLLAAIQGKSTVSDVVQRMAEEELVVCAALADLATDGLVEVESPSGTDQLTDLLFESEPVLALETSLARDITAENDWIDFRESAESVTAAVETDKIPFPDHFPIDDLVGSEELGNSNPWHSVDGFSGLELPAPAADTFQISTAAAAWDDLVSPKLEGDSAERFLSESSDPHSVASEPQAAQSETVAASRALEVETAEEEDVYRQMSTLSPQAAEAIAAALGASLPSEDDARAETASASAGVGENDSPPGFLEEENRTVTRIVDVELVTGDHENSERFPEGEDPLGPISFIGSF